MCQTTRDTLRYYERQGILVPKKNPVNGYHYYSYAQISSYYFIRTFRELDCSVGDIKEYLLGGEEVRFDAFVVLDVCAAPGGKAIHIAELLNGTGHVEARDLTEYKVALIRDNIERSGLTNINAVCQDAAIYDPHKKETADIVIADLPCSGLGVLGKKPDLRYKMNEKTEADLVELQKKILSVVKDYVKPGGKLLYSTCTIHREENEGNVEWFLKEYPEFELVKEKQMIPGRDAGDGFYIAILKRVNHE